MNWEERQGLWFSDPYRIFRNSRGEFDLWIHSVSQNGLVAKGFALLSKAKAFAEKHKEVADAKEALRVTP